MSGSAFNNMYAAIPRRNWALRLSQALNYTGSDNEREILEFLETAEPQDIFSAVANLLTPEEANDERLLNAFGPVIEPYETENAFMLDHPENLVFDSWGNDVDILIGSTSFENGILVGVIRLFPEMINVMANFSSYVPYNLNHSRELREAHGQTLKTTYYGMMEPSITNPDGFITVSNPLCGNEKDFKNYPLKDEQRVRIYTFCSSNCGAKMEFSGRREIICL